jgi:hypothetical protein
VGPPCVARRSQVDWSHHCSLSLRSGKQLDRRQLTSLVHVVFQSGENMTYLDASTIHLACELLSQGFADLEIYHLFKEDLKSQVTANQCLIFDLLASDMDYLDDDELHKAFHLAIRSWCRLLHSLGASGDNDFKSQLGAFLEERVSSPDYCPALVLTLTVATIDGISPFLRFPRAREETWRMMLEDTLRKQCTCGAYRRH